MKTQLRAALALSTLLGACQLAGCRRNELEVCPSDDGTNGGAGGDGQTQTVAEACAEEGKAAGWIAGKAVESTAEASPERIAAFGEETWPLSLELLAAVPVSESPNLAQSATSFYASLGMAYGRWQKGQCGGRIAEVLNFPETGDGAHEAIGASLRALSARSLPGKNPTVVSLMQSRWALDTDQVPTVGPIEQLYGAMPNALLDRGEAGRTLVNCIIEQQSNGLMKDFLPEHALEKLVALDINVAYLKAAWANEFAGGLVDFTAEGGSLARVPGVKSDDLPVLRYVGSAFDALHLSLYAEQLKVMLVVPNDTVTTSLEEFSESLGADELRKARDNAMLQRISFEMPELKIAPHTVDYYNRLGFACEADTLASVFHGATVEMNRDGIEAAAVTVSGQAGVSLEVEQETKFVVDRPFLFFVYDTETRMVLFSGRFMNVE